METPDVELNGPSGPPAARQNNLLHQLVLRDACVAAIADSPAAGPLVIPAIPLCGKRRSWSLCRRRTRRTGGSFFGYSQPAIIRGPSGDSFQDRRETPPSTPS